MAKKRKRRSRKLKKQLKFELIGLLFIFLAIFGSGASAISDGVIPGGLEHIFRFFLGIWYFVASVMLLITGIILVVKRRKPDFSNRKMVGFMIFFMGLLLITHIQIYESLVVSENISIIAATWDQFFTYLSGQATAQTMGGGMAGALFFTFSYYLFSLVGAKIAAVFSMLIGIMFST